MRSQEWLPLTAATLLSAAVAMLVIVIPTVANVEEAWNIVAVSQFLVWARSTFFTSLAHALVLGLPLFLLLRSKNHLNFLASALAGFLIAAVPFGIKVLTFMFGVQNARSGGTPIVVEGVPTLAGWIEYGQAVGVSGLPGLAGGLTFWAVMWLTSQTAGTSTRTEAQRSMPRAGSWIIASLAALSICTIIFLPSVVKDNSCHNLFRDGRRSIGPQIGADIKLNPEDWPALTQIFTAFGTKHSLSFRPDEKIQGGKIMWRSLSLCGETGVNIRAIDQPWLSRTNSPLTDRGTSFSIFELTAGSKWNALARELLGEIEARWSQKTTFRGPDGRVVSFEKAMEGRPKE